jgi:hypothetical protein
MFIAPFSSWVVHSPESARLFFFSFALYPV